MNRPTGPEHSPRVELGQHPCVECGALVEVRDHHAAGYADKLCLPCANAWYRAQYRPAHPAGDRPTAQRCGYCGIEFEDGRARAHHEDISHRREAMDFEKKQGGE